MGGNEADAGVSMGRAKDITMKVIPGSVANPFIRAHHYSGKVVNNSKLHFGVFLDGQLHGVMSYGPSLDKSKIIGLVEGTAGTSFWNSTAWPLTAYCRATARAGPSP